MSKQEVWTSKELKEHLAKKSKKAKESKYRNRPNFYNGNLYHSTKEANYARKLDMLKKSGEVIRWERQLPYTIGVNGTKITKYILDFKVWYTNGRIDHVDVKGQKSGSAYRAFLVKKALMKAILGIEVIEV